MDSAEQASSLDPVLPQDERLPGLALFDDPHQRGRVAELGVLGVQVRRDVLRYHAGRRCTVRIVTDQGSYIVKVFDRRAERVHDVLAAMADAGWVGVRVPRLIGFEPRLQILVTDEFPPDTLETLLARGDGDAPAPWPLAGFVPSATQTFDLAGGSNRWSRSSSSTSGPRPSMIR